MVPLPEQMARRDRLRGHLLNWHKWYFIVGRRTRAASEQDEVNFRLDKTSAMPWEVFCCCKQGISGKQMVVIQDMEGPWLYSTHSIFVKESSGEVNHVIKSFRKLCIVHKHIVFHRLSTPVWDKNKQPQEGVASTRLLSSFSTVLVPSVASEEDSYQNLAKKHGWYQVASGSFGSVTATQHATSPWCCPCLFGVACCSRVAVLSLPFEL